MAKKSPLAIATYILIPLVKVLSDGGDEVQYQRFCLIFDIDGASSIKIFTLLSIFVWVKLVVPKSDLFLCTVLLEDARLGLKRGMTSIYRYIAI